MQLGMELKRGDEVLTTNQDYRRMITTWQREHPRRHRPKADQIARAPRIEVVVDGAHPFGQFPSLK